VAHLGADVAGRAAPEVQPPAPLDDVVLLVATERQVPDDRAPFPTRHEPTALRRCAPWRVRCTAWTRHPLGGFVSAESAESAKAPKEYAVMGERRRSVVPFLVFALLTGGVAHAQEEAQEGRRQTERQRQEQRGAKQPEKGEAQHRGAGQQAFVHLHAINQVEVELALSGMNQAQNKKVREFATKVAKAGVNLDLVYVATRNRVVFGAPDLPALRAALDPSS
jgi:hypothetical protein